MLTAEAEKENLSQQGTDSRANLEVTLGKLTPQFKQLEGQIIVVDGRRLKIHQYALFDLSALNTILGKQNHSSTFFDAWTDVRLSHIRKHDGDTHTPDVCKDIKFLSLEVDPMLARRHFVLLHDPLSHNFY